MIGRTELETQIASLERQQAEARETYLKCDGALSMARHLLGKVLRDEDEAKAKVDSAEAN